MTAPVRQRERGEERLAFLRYINMTGSTEGEEDLKQKDENWHVLKAGGEKGGEREEEDADDDNERKAARRNDRKGRRGATWRA